jgi:acetate kinase
MCQRFDWCGAELDPQRNEETVDREGFITTPGSVLPICVIPTQEGLMMAQDIASSKESNQSP